MLLNISALVDMEPSRDMTTSRRECTWRQLGDYNEILGYRWALGLAQVQNPSSRYYRDISS